MTTSKPCLRPARLDDRRVMLGASEVVAGGSFEFEQAICAVVGQGMPFEPHPEILDWVQIGRIRRQEGQVDMATQAVGVLHELAESCA